MLPDQFTTAPAGQSTFTWDRIGWDKPGESRFMLAASSVDEPTYLTVRNSGPNLKTQKTRFAVEYLSTINAASAGLPDNSIKLYTVYDLDLVAFGAADALVVQKHLDAFMQASGRLEVLIRGGR